MTASSRRGDVPPLGILKWGPGDIEVGGSGGTCPIGWRGNRMNWWATPIPRTDWIVFPGQWWFAGRDQAER